jgi:hypothetical protein
MEALNSAPSPRVVRPNVTTPRPVSNNNRLQTVDQKRIKKINENENDFQNIINKNEQLIYNVRIISELLKCLL